MSDGAPPRYESTAPGHSQAVPLPTIDPAPHGSVIQSWPEVCNIFTQPALLVTRITGTTKGEKFAIYDVSGNIVGYMERDRSKFSGPLFPFSPFVVKVVDPCGQLLLTICRPYLASRPPLQVSVLDPGRGTTVTIGGSQEMSDLFRRRYGMFAGRYVKVSQYNRETGCIGLAMHMKNLADFRNSNTQFGLVSVQSRSNCSPVKNRAGLIVASIDRRWQGVCDELFARPDTYVIRMDRSTFSTKEHRKLGRSLSLDQRVVLLATAIAVDVDYFPPHITYSDEAETAGKLN